MRNARTVLWYALGGAVLYWVFSQTDTGDATNRTVIDYIMNGARGIRNNNPGNIDRKPNTHWVGMSPDQSADSRFVVFSAPEYGIRAMARILRNYRDRGLVTVSHMISTWAPPKENNTAAYIAAVSAETGLSPMDVVTDDDLPAFIAAIIRHENGQQPYDTATIERGIELERTA